MSKVEKIPEYKKRILDLLHENLESLIQNPFGNYAIQHALEVIIVSISIKTHRFIQRTVMELWIKFLTSLFNTLTKSSPLMLLKNAWLSLHQYSFRHSKLIIS